MHAMSVYIAREQFILHQTVERTQACSKDFHTRVVNVLLHMRVFMKFKSSCTIHAVVVCIMYISSIYVVTCHSNRLTNDTKVRNRI